MDKLEIENAILKAYLKKIKHFKTCKSCCTPGEENCGPFWAACALETVNNVGKKYKHEWTEVTHTAMCGKCVLCEKPCGWFYMGMFCKDCLNIPGPNERK